MKYYGCQVSGFNQVFWSVFEANQQAFSHKFHGLQKGLKCVLIDKLVIDFEFSQFLGVRGSIYQDQFSKTNFF